MFRLHGFSEMRTVNSDAVVELLNSRFGYWTIDSDHDPLYDD